MTEPWWVYPIALGVAAYLQLLWHELSHAIGAWVLGGAVTSFKPYPHRAVGQWWFGRVTWRMSATQPRWHHAAPLYADLFTGTIGLVLGLLVWQPLLAVPLAASVDALNWVRGYFGWGHSQPERIDGWKWRYYPNRPTREQLAQSKDQSRE